MNNLATNEVETKHAEARRSLDRLRPKRRSRRNSLPTSANIKLFLLFVSILIVLGSLLYSSQLVDQLREREHRVVQLFARATSYNVTSDQPNDSLYQMIVSFARESEVPIILTDSKDQPTLQHFEKFNMNVPIDSTKDSLARLADIREQLRLMDQAYAPIKMFFVMPETEDTVVTNYIHYGNSLVLDEIESLPMIQLLLGTVIVMIGYLSFSYLKRSEQSNIWVGMAKETAHQLGTPLSSLLGWTEFLRLSSDQPNEVQKIAGEIERDIERLNRIAVRFSKIGSIPDLKPQNLVAVISDVMNYFEGRLPHLRRNIRLELDSKEDEIVLPINRELFEWVMENLIKNAFEAIESKEGSIKVHIERGRGDTVLVDVTDTGKGFEMRRRKDVFRPGFSTKARGWGLGLSLARRIIEDYHHGKLVVKDSAPGKGTTFRMRLPLHEKPRT
ncbi:MAG TPA: ATP-binding protein [Candidatus Kapabacteria bacterium]|nr:ATP-binding protein [Candidatus Kapabacteria bacterium]